MKKGEIYEGIISKVSFPNKGMVDIDGQTVIVKNGMPGQCVRFRINKKRRDRVEGQLLEVLEHSSLEQMEPQCGNFPACGGCLYQTMPYEAQETMKEQQLKELLLPVVAQGMAAEKRTAEKTGAGGQNIPDEETPGMACVYGDDPDEADLTGAEKIFEGIRSTPSQFRYRNKMEFAFGDAEKDGPLTLGLHRKNSTYDILTASDCALVHTDFGKIVKCVLEFFQNRDLPYFHKITHEGYLRHLLVRRAEVSGDLLVDLVTTSQIPDTGTCGVSDMAAQRKTEDIWMREFTDQLLQLPLDGKIVGILHTTNDAIADIIRNDHTEILYGTDFIEEKILGLRFKITPFSFFQTNSRGAEILYETAREFLGGVEDQTVFDLYSGTGTIAQMLAPVAKKVVGVEIVEEAVEAARENAALNGLTNCEFIAGDVLKVLDDLEDKPDTIVLDPPRDGIHPKALPKIIAYGVERIVYISCKPTSLARDLEVLQAGGYSVERMCGVDMFPNTQHVETVCLLSKLSEAKNHISVKVEMDEMDLTAAESKATYQEIQDWVQEKYGFHVTQLNIAKTKRKCGIIERQNYNLPKSEDSRSPETPKEKEKAIIESFKAFQMI
ncbi:MAG: 23S rRNA (uracil(1939)-C(5))-methyltransferase RlmD [Eubacterium sp.]|nr:23S rRNA (uracil(1939)-C(5))-methyltransferase RlmD [Eubacterium sp.]